jgi:hypothetical protein
LGHAKASRGPFARRQVGLVVRNVAPAQNGQRIIDASTKQTALLSELPVFACYQRMLLLSDTPSLLPCMAKVIASLESGSLLQQGKHLIVKRLFEFAW